MESASENVDDFSSELIRLRRMFHKKPETGFTEYWTTARICEYLSRFDCSIVYGEELYDNFTDPELLKRWDNDIFLKTKKANKDDKWIARLEGKTGLVAVINGAKPGPNFGFRFDIDGLPIKESDGDEHLPFREGFHSANENMHACGHDGHITIGLGLIRKLTEYKDNLKGNYYIFFQPAEELISGGKIFAKLSFVKELDYFFPIHLGLTGEKKIICGLAWLADKRFNVLFKGRSSHAGGFPQEGKNALLAACTAVKGLYSITRHSGGSTRINVGKFVSGNASNIISDKAGFEMDLRGLTNEVCDFLVSQAENIIKGASTMYDVEYEIEFSADAETAVNSSELIVPIKSVCTELGIEEGSVLDSFLIPASEDATFIMNEVLRNGGQSTFIGIGCQTYGGHHNEKFDFDEENLSLGVDILFNLPKTIID